MDNADYDPALFYYDGAALDFSTPRLESRSTSPAAGQSQQTVRGAALPLLQLSDWNENLAYDEYPPTCIHYSIVWNLLLKKGERRTKLMYKPELEQDLVLAPGALWNRFLKQKLEERLKQQTPSSKYYEPKETVVVVSVADRAEHDFSKSYPELNIDWEEAEKQLRTWSPLFHGGRKLQIEVTLICKPTIRTAAMNTRSRSRRGATGRQHAELEAEQEEEEAAGRPNHWAKVYAIMRCDGPPCSGVHCWRDPEHGNTHFPCDGEVMEELVAYSEGGATFEAQKDVPTHIRDLIYKKDRETQQRKENKKRKRQDSLSGKYPIQITNVLPGPSNHASTEASTDATPEESDEWSIPEPRDIAIKRYCIWHCARVCSDVWKENLKKAATITFRLGLDLKHVYMSRSIEVFTKEDDGAGVLPGIAESWVQDVREWVHRLNKGQVQ